MEIPNFPPRERVYLFLILSHQMLKGSRVTREDALNQYSIIVSHQTPPEKSFINGTYITLYQRSSPLEISISYPDAANCKRYNRAESRHTQ